MQPGYSNFEVSLLDENAGVPDQYNPLANAAGQTVDFLTEVRYKKVKTPCCVCSCSCCCRWTLYVVFVVCVAIASTILISLRELIFDFDSTEDYYFADVENYAGFLAWGDSGTDDLLLNLSASAQQNAYGVALSVDGWANLCRFPEMALFVAGSKDSARCSYSNPAGYLQGCAAGFYQPGMDAQHTARPCPDGFFCPANFACTVACVPGAQCYNSTFDAGRGTCRFPKTMVSAPDAAEPLQISVQNPAAVPTPAPSHVVVGVAKTPAPSPAPSPASFLNAARRAADATGGLSVAGKDEAEKEKDGGEELELMGRALAQPGATTVELVCPGAGNMFLCKGGFYCPTAVSFVPCPAGSYCPVGSIGPKPCSAIASCHAKAAYPDYREQVVELSVLLVGVFVVCLKGFRKVRSHLREKRRQKKLAAARLAHRRGAAAAIAAEAAYGDNASLLGGHSGDDDDTSALEAFGFPHRGHGGGQGGGMADLASPPSPLAGGSSSSSLHRSGSQESIGSQEAILGGGGRSSDDRDREPLASLRDKQDTQLELAFVRLGLVLRANGAKVLNGVTGRCRPGRVTAIMGPSGAGKTTLMNTLAGRATYGQRFGTLLVNGVVDSVVSYSDLVGFVPQDDIMHDDLSVKENLTMYAGLRLPATLNRQHRLAVVRDVMSVLEIDRIAHAVVGNTEKRGISGGQRKRVNIAMEMVADPSLLFLDEPTSGLDSTTSFAVIGALRELSRKGANVIAVLHQPSYQIFELFDDVIFLARGGFSVYVGPATGAARFFVELGFDCPPLVNPADFFMDVIAGKYRRAGDPAFAAEDLIALWEVREDAQGLVAGPSSTAPALRPVSAEALRRVKPAGFWRSLRFFLVRAVTQQLRASPQLLADTVLESFAGLLVGVLYPHLAFANLAGFLSFMCLALGLTISIASLRVFGNERLVFWREAAPGSGMRLDKFAYFMAKNLVELPRLIVLSFFFTMAFYPVVTPNVAWFCVWAYACAAAFACSGLAYFASIALSPLKAQLLVVIYVLVAVMFSGLATKLGELEDNPLFVALSYLSFARWQAELVYLQTVRALSVAWRLPPSYYAKAGQHSALEGLIGLRYTPLDLVFALDVALLLLLGVAFRVLAFVALVAFNRDKRGLPTLAHMSLYWVVNPLDDWARARGEQQALASRRARVQSHTQAGAAQGPNRSRAGTDSGTDNGGSLGGSAMGVGGSGEEEFFVAVGSGGGLGAGGGFAAPPGGYDLYPEPDYQNATEEL